jgi:NAD(P)-dependent dehydrogenase (short-subunit alcohol dehydrogenase family)
MPHATESPLPLPPDLSGRLAVVTGAAHGIGYAISRLLLQADVRLLGIDKDEQALNEAFSDRRCMKVAEDISQRDTARLASDLVAAHGPIELIVNNVGITTPHSFLSLDEKEFDLVFRTNLKGPWFFTKGLVRELIDAKRPGSIVFISSLHDTEVRMHPHYSASKAAVAMLIRELAYELAEYRIRVNAVSPGAIQTAPSVANEQRLMKQTELIPMGRIGSPEDIARATLFLLSDHWSSYITGTNVVVDGGLTLHDWLMDL